ncbi:heterokaryon incompatibility protein-domain-containing protein [Leptodontidium sp. MPI-SDFR-AT-0119]|nr:heterokaryon incompatibility protein-domain-containing protein [Leptodontidium sp. MPI-SDFR-AT-0119]
MTITPQCNSQKGAQLPSRVLDIKPKVDKSVVLVDTRNSVCETNQYMTLSHCWGKHQFIQTAKASLETRMKRIEWDSLPKTFQDSVDIAQAFGVRYLWIDALCIIQDDGHDWKQESARMASIYSDSYLNIAATGAADGRGDCLSPRTILCGSQKTSLESIPINPTSPNQPIIFVRPSLEHIHNRYSTLVKHYSSSPDADSVPLLSRAWAFQERYLAPRTLHFHPSEVILECKTGLRCECLGLDSVVRGPFRECLSQEPPITEHSNLKERYDRWFKVVEEYSRLSLTRQSDRLIALIGVATVFQAELGDDYLAGLWKGDFARGLLWHITRPVGTSTRHLTRRHETAFAPTWSWANLILDTEEMGIVFPAGYDDSFATDQRLEVLETNLSPDPAMWIESTNGALRVRGAVTSAIMCERNDASFQGKNAVLILDGDINNDFVLISTSDFDLDVLRTADSGSSKDDTCIVHCLIVGNTIDGFVSVDQDPGEKAEYFCALILSSSASGVYKRIGVLDVKKETMICESSTVMELDLT